MDKIVAIVKLFIGGIISCISYLLGGYDALLLALFLVICLDIITGSICAITNKELNSKTSFKGLSKKVVIILYVMLASITDNVMGTEISRNMVILWFIGSEGISILENGSKIGVPFPNKIKDFLSQLKNEGD